MPSLFSHFKKCKSLALMGLITFFLLGCAGSNPNPNPVLGMLLSPINYFADGVETRSHANFKPERIKEVVVSVEDPYSHLLKGDLEYQIESILVGELLIKGYKIPSRSDLNKIVNEITFQKKQNTNDNAELGYMMNVSAQLVVRITKSVTEPITKEEDGIKKQYYLNHIALSARLINVQSSEIYWTATVSQDNWINKDMEVLSVEKAVKAIARALPDRDNRSIIDKVIDKEPHNG